MGGLGTSILTTSRGVMTGREAAKAGVGGEVLCNDLVRVIDMSRIGKKPIPVPKGVTVTVNARRVEVKGPKGTLAQRVPPGVKFEVKGAELVATTERPDPR